MNRYHSIFEAYHLVMNPYHSIFKPYHIVIGNHQHLRLLQAPSSLMKYKNETNVGHIYLSTIDILSYLWNISLGYAKSSEKMSQQQSAEDLVVF